MRDALLSAGAAAATGCRASSVQAEQDTEESTRKQLARLPLPSFKKQHQHRHASWLVLIKGYTSSPCGLSLSPNYLTCTGAEKGPTLGKGCRAFKRRT